LDHLVFSSRGARLEHVPAELLLAVGRQELLLLGGQLRRLRRSVRAAHNRGSIAVPVAAAAATVAATAAATAAATTAATEALGVTRLALALARHSLVAAEPRNLGSQSCELLPWQVRRRAPLLAEEPSLDCT
jgi:hypothetical protein